MLSILDFNNVRKRMSASSYWLSLATIMMCYDPARDRQTDGQRRTGEICYAVCCEDRILTSKLRWPPLCVFVLRVVMVITNGIILSYIDLSAILLMTLHVVFCLYATGAASNSVCACFLFLADCT